MNLILPPDPDERLTWWHLLLILVGVAFIAFCAGIAVGVSR